MADLPALLVKMALANLPAWLVKNEASGFTGTIGNFGNFYNLKILKTSKEIVYKVKKKSDFCLVLAQKIIP